MRRHLEHIRFGTSFNRFCLVSETALAGSQCISLWKLDELSELSHPNSWGLSELNIKVGEGSVGENHPFKTTLVLRGKEDTSPKVVFL